MLASFSRLAQHGHTVVRHLDNDASLQRAGERQLSRPIVVLHEPEHVSSQ
jgi:hypothetical protein